MKAILVPVISVLAMLGGCTTDPNRLYLNVNCMPYGGMIMEGGRTLAMCPGYINYPVTSVDRVRGYVETRDLTVQWASGASSSVSSLSIPLSRGLDQEVTFERPAGVSGLEADLRVDAATRQTMELRSLTALQERELAKMRKVTEGLRDAERRRQRRRRERGLPEEDDC